MASVQSSVQCRLLLFLYFMFGYLKFSQLDLKTFLRSLKIYASTLSDQNDMSRSGKIRAFGDQFNNPSPVAGSLRVTQTCKEN